ncbi:hypothetical protein CBR_g23795 [Chara braunii]|uniref:CCHC-type domain-containing protein n=1 Tax=Chara braunii TaxID=69332 RepID=A0A388JVJ8_CHABU|nr:hypothetical protein CBR_g23795 [Chara braunii]|eukprot:GBG61839.1 hypothetical protein CBR_g23795 [Chara braunii]
MASFPNTNSNSNLVLPSSSIVRTCYNCGDPGHFVRCFPHPRPANPSSVIVQSDSPLLTLATSSVSGGSSTFSNGSTSQFGRGFGWNQAKQRLDLLEHIVAEIKIRHDSEVERERSVKDEEEKRRKEKEEERRASEKKDREEFRKLLTDSMNARLDGVVELLRGKGSSCEVEALRKDIERLGKKLVEGATSSSAARCSEGDGLLAQLLAEQERMRSQLEEAMATKRRLEGVEKDMKEVIKARDEARADAEKWQEEANRPGKRGCIALNTPAAKVVTRPPRSSPRKSPVASVDLRRVADMHRMEVETIQGIRTREFNTRREAEQELEKARAKIVLLEKE